jgi:hypothetical protein
MEAHVWRAHTQQLSVWRDEAGVLLLFSRVIGFR